MKHTFIWFCLLVAGFMPAVLLAQDTQDNSDQITKVEKKVTKHLNSYYMIKGAAGITSSSEPQCANIDIDSTKPVQGWTRRYETTGTATIIMQRPCPRLDPQVSDGRQCDSSSASNHTPNYVCHFDVISEIDDQGAVQIVDTRSERVHD